jgi:hypothetical protein
VLFIPVIVMCIAMLINMSAPTKQFRIDFNQDSLPSLAYGRAALEAGKEDSITILSVTLIWGILSSIFIACDR